MGQETSCPMFLYTLFSRDDVENAVLSADVLNLPVEFVSKIFQAVEDGKGNAGIMIYNQMERLKALIY